MKKFLLISLVSITHLFGSAPQQKAPAQTDLKLSGEWITPAMVDRPYIKDFKHISQRVISDNRLKKMEQLTKNLAAEAMRVGKLKKSLLILARSSNERTQAERKEHAAAQAQLRFAHNKYKGFKKSATAFVQAAQTAQTQLERDLFSSRVAYEHLSARSQIQDQESRVQLERLQIEMMAARAQIAREVEERESNAKYLNAQVVSARSAHCTALQKYETALEDLDKIKGERQNLEQRLASAHTTHSTLEQQLRTELTAANAAQATAIRNHQIASSELNTVRSNLQNFQQQLTQLHADKIAVEQQLNQRLQQSQTERAATEQKLRAELTASQTAHATTNQSYQNTQQQLQQEKSARAAIEQQLRTQLGAAQAAHATATHNHQTAAAELNTTRTSLQSFQQQLTQMHADKTSSEQQLNQRMQQAQTERAAAEQKLRAELTAAHSAHTSAQQNYQATLTQLNASNATVQQLQGQLQQERTTRASTEEQLRTQQAAAKTATDNAQRNYKAIYDELNTYKAHFATAQTQLEQEKAGRTSIEQKLRAELSTQGAHATAYANRTKQLETELTTANNAHSTEKASLVSQLQLANAARARYQTLKNFIIDHYTHHHAQACTGNNASYAIIGALHNITNGLAHGSPFVKRGHYNVPKNFTAGFNAQFAS